MNRKVEEELVNLPDVLVGIWENKWASIVLLALFVAGSYFYVKQRERVYTVDTLLLPVESSGPVQSLNSPLSALVGGNSSATSSKSAEAFLVLSAKGFTDWFIEEYGIKQSIARQCLDSEASQEEVRYTTRQATGKWLGQMLDLKQMKNGSVSVSLTWCDRGEAYRWLSLLIKEINSYMREKTIKDAQANIAFLERSIESAVVIDIRSMLYSMIEEETRAKMLAITKEEFVYTYVDPPVLPDKGAYSDLSSRALFIVLLLGFFPVSIFLPVALSWLAEQMSIARARLSVQRGDD